MTSSPSGVRAGGGVDSRRESAVPAADAGLTSRVAQALASGTMSVVVEPPGAGHGYWAGGPSAVFADGVFYLAYRLRRPVDRGRGYANVVATSADGLHFQTVATVLNSSFDSASLERPALIRRPDGGWRLYVSCSTPGSKHWWVEAIDADTVAGLAVGGRTVVLPGDAFTAAAGPFDREGHTLRYVTVVELPDGLRCYFETARNDGANHLCSTWVPK